VALPPTPTNTPGGRDGALDHGRDLVLVECGRFAGRAQREQPVDALVEIVRDEALVALEVDGTVLERRDERQPEAGDLGGHGRKLGVGHK
jgi:hypothetical protein